MIITPEQLSYTPSPTTHNVHQPKTMTAPRKSDLLSSPRRRPNDVCYLCGIRGDETPEGNLTRDHLPPLNLFPKTRRSNLIRVPCCYQCNNAAHNDDEYLRVAVSGQYNSNNIGKEVWKDKVVGSTLRKRRIRPAVNELSASFKQIALITPQGVEDAIEGRMQAAPINRVLMRMTKGFLSLLYPEIDRGALTFRISQLDIFKVNHPLFEQIRCQLRYFERGNGVYRCWYQGDTNYSWKGLWTHMFFDSAWYLVEQTSDRKIEMPWRI